MPDPCDFCPADDCDLDEHAPDCPNSDNARDNLLLQTILDLDIGTIANIIQTAKETEGPLYDRLAYGYYEHTNRDDGGDTLIRLNE